MKTTYTVTGLVKGRQQTSTIASGLGTSAAADRTAAEAVSQGATNVSITPVEIEEPGVAERIEMEIADSRLKMAMKNLRECGSAPGSMGEAELLQKIDVLKRDYFQAVEDYKATKSQ